MNFTPKLSVFIFVWPLALFLGSCASRGSNDAISVDAQTAAADQQIVACEIAAYGSPAAAALAPKMPRDAAQPSIQQTSDPTFPDDGEMTNLYEFQRLLAPCRGVAIEAYSKFAPSIAETSVNEFEKEDAQLKLLTRNKQTWGQYNRTMQSLTIQYRERVTQIAQEMNKQFQQSNPVELAQRQHALETYLQYLQGQQAVAQEDHLIDR